jgi:hypothetical protein
MAVRNGGCPAKWRTGELAAVWCDLDAGHAGDHESTVTITWADEDSA